MLIWTDINRGKTEAKAITQLAIANFRHNKKGLTSHTMPQVEVGEIAFSAKLPAITNRHNTSQTTVIAATVIKITLLELARAKGPCLRRNGRFKHVPKADFTTEADSPSR